MDVVVIAVTVVIAVKKKKRQKENISAVVNVLKKNMKNKNAVIVVTAVVLVQKKKKKQNSNVVVHQQKENMNKTVAAKMRKITSKKYEKLLCFSLHRKQQFNYFIQFYKKNLKFRSSIFEFIRITFNGFNILLYYGVKFF